MMPIVNCATGTRGQLFLWIRFTHKLCGFGTNRFSVTNKEKVWPLWLEAFWAITKNASDDDEKRFFRKRMCDCFAMSKARRKACYTQCCCNNNDFNFIFLMLASNQQSRLLLQIAQTNHNRSTKQQPFVTSWIKQVGPNAFAPILPLILSVENGSICKKWERCSPIFWKAFT